MGDNSSDDGQPAARLFGSVRLRSTARTLLHRYFPQGVALIRGARLGVYRTLARRARNRCSTYVGVTGSCGKSTAAHLIARLLERAGHTKAGVRRNTPAAVFRSLAGLREPVDFFVQEISGDEPGRIAAVSAVVRPDIAVVTTVGQDHFRNFREVAVDRPADMQVDEYYRTLIAWEKGSLVAALGPEGVACLNADQELVRAMAGRCKGRVILYGTSPDAEVRAENVSAVWPQRLSFDLVIGSLRRRVETRFVGNLMLTSVLSALAAAHAAGVDLDRAVSRLAEIEPVDKRMNVEVRGDHTYVLDTQKAPLWQVELLIGDLVNLRGRSLVFVLGEISDTRGDKSMLYRRLLRRASDHADQVVGFGPAASSANKVRLEGRDNVMALETYDQVRQHLAGLPPSLVILKSGKLTRMERILDAPGSGKVLEKVQ